VPALMFEGELSRLFRHRGNVPGNIRFGQPRLLCHWIVFRGASCKEDCEGCAGQQSCRFHGQCPSRLRHESPIEWEQFHTRAIVSTFSSKESSFASSVTLASLSKAVANSLEFSRSG